MANFIQKWWRGEEVDVTPPAPTYVPAVENAVAAQADAEPTPAAESCANCKCWAPMSTLEREGVCRAESPQVVMIMRANVSVSGRPSLSSAWPTTMRDEWCGCWRAR